MNNEDRCVMLLTPSNSPELSPIENMFARTKKQMKRERICGEKNLLAL